MHRTVEEVAGRFRLMRFKFEFPCALLTPKVAEGSNAGLTAIIDQVGLSFISR